MDPRLLAHALAAERTTLLDLCLALAQELGWSWNAILDMDVQCFWCCIDWLAALRKREKAALEGHDHSASRSPMGAGSL